MSHDAKDVSGSEPLRGRAERFAVLIAAGGLSQVQAYCQSSEPPVSFTKGRAVSASRLANREDVQERVSWLRKSQAEALTANAEPVTRASIHRLLEEVTAALMDASKAASKAGANHIAQQLHKCLVVHAGRSHRASARAPAKEQDRPSFNSTRALAGLKWCACNA